MCTVIFTVQPLNYGKKCAVAMNHNYSSGINASFKLSWCQGNLPLTLELCNSVILARCLQDCLYPLRDNYLLRCGDNYNDSCGASSQCF